MTIQTAESDFVFDRISNFRDFGGSATADGRRVRRGVLYRSAHHAEATEADLRRLAELGIRTVVDLRRPSERRSQPSPAYVDAMLLHDRISSNDAAVAPHMGSLQVAGAGAPKVVEWLMGSYRNYPFDAAYTALFRDYFRALAETDGGVLIHCAAGKDRTGFICALTLTALGVDQAQVEHDYLETNRLHHWSNRLDSTVERIERETGKPVDREGMKAALSADLRYLEAAFEALHAEHPDVDAYLEAALGVTPAMRERLRARLTVEA